MTVKEKRYMEALLKFSRGEIPFEKVQEADPTRAATLETATKAAKVRIQEIRRGHVSRPVDLVHSRH